MRRYVVVFMVMALVMAFAPAAMAAPGDGNGKKDVAEGIFGPFPVFCDDDEVPDLEVIVDFRAQFMAKEHGKNFEVATFNVEFLYTDAAGESWVFKDRGSDRLYEEGGDLYQAVSGRASAGNIGLLVIKNPFTEDEQVVFQKGQAIDADAEACARLG